MFFLEKYFSIEAYLSEFLFNEIFPKEKFYERFLKRNYCLKKGGKEEKKYSEGIFYKKDIF